LLASNPGKPHPIKLQEQHKSFFKPDHCIDEYAGEQLMKWAKGGISKPAPPEPAAAPQLHQPVETPLSAEDTAMLAGLHSHALPPSTDDPAEPYRAKLRTCERSNTAINHVWNNIPETVKQDCYQEYTMQLKAVSKKK
jgi:hypothetical protein